MTALRSTLMALCCLLLLTLSVGQSMAGMAFECEEAHCAELMQDNAPYGEMAPDSLAHGVMSDDLSGKGCGLDCGQTCLQIAVLKQNSVSIELPILKRYDRRTTPFLIGADPEQPERPPSML